MCDIYKKIYDEEFNKLTKWKKGAIIQDFANKKSSGLTNDFIKLVIERLKSITNKIKIYTPQKKKSLNNMCDISYLRKRCCI